MVFHKYCPLNTIYIFVKKGLSETPYPIPRSVFKMVAILAWPMLIGGNCAHRAVLGVGPGQ